MNAHELQVNNTNQISNTFIPKTKWVQLSQEDRQNWGKLSGSAKHVILSKEKDDTPRQLKLNIAKSNTKQCINSTDIDEIVEGKVHELFIGSNENMDTDVISDGE
mmetsp:Transcript_1216/g.1852  ORF Transcript_1216/g.1852 Transcript_1216/m.1852 type:complete len:105 (-) Transcript_1216:403-717(-)|eukprot:CAMPEP_0195512358 /NCGR_PEP_ID=MMETSP0794_2-20130614/4344_1 /TAXON_ID=515487 /ORGANISM="Stephanopyxis turris, Strain CCMP 815" /LENGTH=104 /DNA_ID=CAMNT_0040640125 /DNA_START=282 /DNA_END=596 /DNA_ORIENTATION=+